MTKVWTFTQREEEEEEEKKVRLVLNLREKVQFSRLRVPLMSWKLTLSLPVKVTSFTPDLLNKRRSQTPFILVFFGNISSFNVSQSARSRLKYHDNYWRDYSCFLLRKHNIVLFDF